MWSDFIKPADMLSDDYGSKKTMKIKHSALGATFTSTTESKKGSLLSKLSAKYALKHFKPINVKIDKVELKPDTSLLVETTVDGVAKGLALKLKVSKASGLDGTVGADYSTDMIAASFKTDALQLGNQMDCDVVTSFGDIAMGACVKVPAESDVDYTLGARIVNDSFFAAVTAATQGSDALKYALYGTVNATPELLIGAKAVIKGTVSEADATVGVSYKLHKDTTVKAKLDRAKGDVGASVAVKHTLEKGCTVTTSCDLPFSSLSNYKLGFGLEMS
jgi:hypothetical protein